MSTALGDILSTDPAPEAPEAPAAEEVKVEEVVPETPEEKSEEAPAEPQAAPTAEKPPEQDDMKGQVEAFKAKALDETRKRQELERQLEAQQQQPEPIDAYAEPDKAIEQAVSNARLLSRSEALDDAEVYLRGVHTDFDEMKEHFFNEMAPDLGDPLRQKAMGMSPMAAYNFVYTQAKNHQALKGVEDIGEWQKQKEAEIEVKVRAEFEAKDKKAKEDALIDTIPGTLSTTTAAGGNATQPFAGPTPLSKIIGKR